MVSYQGGSSRFNPARLSDFSQEWCCTGERLIGQVPRHSSSSYPAMLSNFTEVSHQAITQASCPTFPRVVSHQGDSLSTYLGTLSDSPKSGVSSGRLITQLEPNRTKINIMLNHILTATGHWANKCRLFLFYLCICTVLFAWRTKKGPCVNSLLFCQ